MPGAAARAAGVVPVEPACRWVEVAAELPVEAPRAAVDLLSGGPVVGWVLGVSSSSALIELGSRVLVLGPERAHRTPVTLRSAHWPSLPPAALVAGARVTATGGRLDVAGLRFRVVRSWDSRVVRIRPHPPAVALFGAATRSAGRGIGDEPVAAFAEAVAAESAGRSPVSRCNDRSPGAGQACQPPLVQAVRGMVGMGAGSTPAGDDVLAGALVGLLATGRNLIARAVIRAIGDPAGRTTALSRELLLLAGQRQASGEVLAVLRQLDARNGTPPRLSAAVDRLLAVGHTSGADLAAGLLIGLGADGPVHGAGDD